jgi:hypothetical protein
MVIVHSSASLPNLKVTSHFCSSNPQVTCWTPPHSTSLARRDPGCGKASYRCYHHHHRDLKFNIYHFSLKFFHLWGKSEKKNVCSECPGGSSVRVGAIAGCSKDTYRDVTEQS